ncbi:DUF5415 family protein [Virgibacillus halodenitrificans]|uniref:DUF5415 family protein n=1 Tax=Virgibacillus halodenitrificans TaxID=1482 RepID=UPI00045CC466|nr:DUF5415 family protein [Virgibacillus halodenitrificans]CDQ37706.1 hypothetical protein BN993_07268 [Virgibacillus halodenitrificans]
MAGKRKENPVKEAVEKILKKNGHNYNDWKKEVINKRKLEVMSGEDKEWTESTVQEASFELIMEEINKEPRDNQESSFKGKFEKQN